MKFSLIAVLEAIMISSSLSMDAFIASLAYGSNKIKIPMSSVQIINVICSSVLGISFALGTLIKNYIPVWLTATVCFAILFIIGAAKLLDCATKSIIKKYNNLKKEFKFSLFNFKFILNLYANPIEADVDSSKVISSGEAVSVAVAMSLDSLAVGIGLAFANVNGLWVTLFSLIATPLAIMLGCYIGNKAAQKLPFSISWLSGVLLIALAFLKII